ncbi:hypothetical protein SERLADRAFT_475982 [Serpula lacrymans var. lacrymans S7.9]|uniref:Uncharacterized protein n=1 Tax=Serpula lacrymans var. lacrymans (strain S7.9) TaxID=578457 RepID=F8P6U9_SERL9|nr:uncharacterized protein SERLADRAFT_475982 [Serpula lacrymans var. lacrymans S7.9]EGO21165.1 hypothetical protein SERLADRAFT_475982 [Serpula lacrymans var. lacrymans S7.9]
MSLGALPPLSPTYFLIFFSICTYRSPCTSAICYLGSCQASLRTAFASLKASTIDPDRHDDVPQRPTVSV